MDESSKKLRGNGGQASELTRLKSLWRTLSDEARAYWQDLFTGSTTQAEIRRALAAKLKVELKRDGQLTEFRDWLSEQIMRDAMARRIEDRKLELLAGGMGLDEAQDVLLAEAAIHSAAAKDFKLGLQVSQAISTRHRDSLEARRIKLLEKKGEAYDRAQAALVSAKESKGGITPETLKKIEQELRLL